MKVIRLSSQTTGYLILQGIILVPLSVREWVDLRATVWSKLIKSLKIHPTGNQNPRPSSMYCSASTNCPMVHSQHTITPKLQRYIIYSFVYHLEIFIHVFSWIMELGLCWIR